MSGEDEIDKLKLEREALRKYAFEATKALTDLVGGGSELFAGKIGGMYKADLPFCIERLRARFSNVHEVAAKAVAARKELEAENAALRKRLVVDDAMIERGIDAWVATKAGEQTAIAIRRIIEAALMAGVGSNG